MSGNGHKVCLIAGNLGKIARNNQFKPGLGTVIAQDLLNSGATVIITDLNNELLIPCAESLSKKIFIKECDFLMARTSEHTKVMTDKGPKDHVRWIKNPVKEMIESIIHEFGRLDVIIANFDYYKHNKIEKSNDAFFDELKKYNIDPTFRLMAGAREALSQQKKVKNIHAQIVLITNIAGKAGISLGSIYSGMKGGIIGLTKCLAREFSRFANVNAISYGLLSHRKMQGPLDRFKKNFMTTQSQSSKLALKFEHIAPVASFLTSKGARAMNGQILNVDAGLWLKLEA